MQDVACVPFRQILRVLPQAQETPDKRAFLVLRGMDPGSRCRFIRGTSRGCIMLPVETAFYLGKRFLEIDVANLDYALTLGYSKKYPNLS